MTSSKTTAQDLVNEYTAQPTVATRALWNHSDEGDVYQIVEFYERPTVETMQEILDTYTPAWPMIRLANA